MVPIVTAQGYHLEQEGELISFATQTQLVTIAKQLQHKLAATNAMRQRMTDWDAFARRHVEHWRAQLTGLAAARQHDLKAAA